MAIYTDPETGYPPDDLSEQEAPATGQGDSGLEDPALVDALAETPQDQTQLAAIKTGTSVSGAGRGITAAGQKLAGVGYKRGEGAVDKFNRDVDEQSVHDVASLRAGYKQQSDALQEDAAAHQQYIADTQGIHQKQSGFR